MRYVFLMMACLCFTGFQTPKNRSEWIDLLDKDLSQWEKYLSYRHQKEYDGQIPRDKNGKELPPLVADTAGVFSVSIENEEPILRISGEVYGCITTKSIYENYHLMAMVKWGNAKWEPRKEQLRDSGILYHSIGENGVDYWRSWQLSQEFQIMEGHMGDYWNIANSAIDIRAFLPEGIMNPVADTSQDFLPIGQGTKNNGFCLRSNNYESKPGQWTTLELICFEGKSLHIVNNKVVMVLQNSRYVKNGESIALTKGKIQLQSEAAEVFFKKIKIKQIASLPESYARYF